ncbi:MND1-interacting protein 1 [Morus notabilis]|uniref:MND1-interacting protein 1 n=1 Tax=Morus notabilis TaxID=981085 RepID=UPI000CED50E0|nr:MND1-interacting protein 1 [Morus notabilis]
MSGSGRQKKGKRKPHLNKPSNKSGSPSVEHCPELTPGHCDSDTGPELCGTQNTMGMHANLKPTQSSSPFVNNPMYCSEEELENMLLNKLEIIYKQAIAKLMSFGYPRDVVWNAILTCGYVFGDEDILTNIVQNSVEYIKTKKSKRNETHKDRPRVAENLRPSVKSSLAVMIFTLCQAQPNLKKIEAMRCLLMTNFDLGFSSILTVMGKPTDGKFKVDLSKRASSSGVCTVHGDQEFADCENSVSGNKRLVEEFEKFLGKSRIRVMGSNLTPSQQARLKKSVANLAVAFQAELKESSEGIQAEKNFFLGKMSTKQFEWEDSCMDNLMLDAIEKSVSDEESKPNCVDKRSNMISMLVHDIKEAKKEVEERKEWAKKKVVEAAKKLSHDLLELKALRMQKRKQKCESECDMIEQEERMMLRLMELENAMDQTTCQYDMLNKASYDMENVNAEIRAEIEAYKLRTSETDEKIAKVASKEKKSVKKAISLEKHNSRLLEEIEQERKKSLQLQQQMADLQAAQEQIEVIWRQEVKAKELALNQLQEEWKLKEETDVRIKRRHQALHQKMETERLKYKDEIRQLEQEIAQLQMSSGASNDLYHLPDYLFSWDSEVLEINARTFQNQFRGSSEQTGFSENEVIYDRMCMICMEKEVSVLLLPCAHQVICASCSSDYYYQLEARCPCCEGPIDERIHVYGGRS